MSLVSVRDYRHPAGWANPKKGAARARHYCEQLEGEQVLFFDSIPFEFPEADREFLLSLRWSHSRYHKNISYKPGKDQLGGFASIGSVPPDVTQPEGLAGSTSKLVQAMAGFGGGSGAADGLNAGLINADASQQTFLTTPPHA